MYDQFVGIVNINGQNKWEFQQKRVIQQHHHVNLNQNFHEDCKIWKEFLDAGSYNGRNSNILRPFLDVFKMENSDYFGFFH